MVALSWDMKAICCRNFAGRGRFSMEWTSRNLR